MGETMSFKIIVPASLIAAALVFGATGTSEAKGKKKEAAPPQTAFCMTAPPAPVCGVRGGMKFDYANSCYAVTDGAKVSRAGACKAAKKGKKAKKKKM
jgi:hypothetical protein